MRRGLEYPDNTTESVRAELPLQLLVVLLFLLAVMIYMAQETENNSLRVQVEWDYSVENNAAEHPLDAYREERLREARIPLRPGHSRADVDLYVARLSPVRECVWFSSQTSGTLKLDQDDRGWDGHNPDDDRNVEIVSGRRSTLALGLYAVNLHLYDRASETLPISAFVDVVIGEGTADEARVSEEVKLTAQGQEVNVLTFEIDEKGQLVPDSLKLRQQTVRLLQNGACGVAS